MENITVYSHNDCLTKDNGQNHPERKERLESILASIKEINNPSVTIKVAPLADFDSINLVHPQSLP